MAVNTDAAQVLDNWSKGMAAAGPKYEAGIRRVTEAPGQKAAAQQEAMRANFNAAIDDGTWAANTAAVPLEVWREQAIKVGRARLQTGVEKGKRKLEAVLPALLNFVAAAVANLPARGTRDQNKDRMNQFSDRMAEFRKRNV